MFASDRRVVYQSNTRLRCLPYRLSNQHGAGMMTEILVFLYPLGGAQKLEAHLSTAITALREKLSLQQCGFMRQAVARVLDLVNA
jgi:hypothetical protein